MTATTAIELTYVVGMSLFSCLFGYWLGWKANNQWRKNLERQAEFRAEAQARRERGSH